MQEIKEDAAERSYGDIQNALEDSGVKPMVTRSPIRPVNQANLYAEEEYSRQVSPAKGATVLPDVKGPRKGDFKSVPSVPSEDSGFRPPSNEKQLAADLDEALNALDDLGDIPIPAQKDESAESELF